MMEKKRGDAALGISRTEHDPQEPERVCRIGRAEALKMLPQVRGFPAGPEHE